MIYFDNSATSPVDEEVLEAMLPYLKEEYGNPSSKYYCKATSAKIAVEQARENVAKLIGAKMEEIIFTTGATESTNFVIKGYMDYQKYYGDGRNHIITTVAEHKATLNVCKYLNGEIYSNDDSTPIFSCARKVDRGYEASFIGVNEYGQVYIDEFEHAIQKNTTMASVIYVNNEVGAINDIKSLAEICNNRNIAFHTDITQALGKLPIDVKEIGCDYMSFSAHKIYGPKGIGGAYLKADDYGIKPITVFMHGGEQEGGLRAGTLSVHNIVGFGKAAEIAGRDFKKNNRKIDELDSYLIKAVTSIPEVELTNTSDRRIPGIVSLVVDKNDFNNERFIKRISDEIALSTGSACSAGEPSHVICAMRLGSRVSKVLRISISKFIEKKEIDELVKTLKANL